MEIETHTFTCDFSDGNSCTLVMDKYFNMAAKWKFDPNWDVIKDEYLKWKNEIANDIVEILNGQMDEIKERWTNK